MAHHTPRCNICSFKQPRSPVPIYHRHSSSREARVLQGAEYATRNCSYLCPTCQAPHMAVLPYGLDICVSDSTLHDIHHPREAGVECLPDTSHVDWLTIPGATLKQLLFAWQVEYAREDKPMRVLLMAGLNDLVKGGGAEYLTEQVTRFKENVSYQNFRHPGRNNSFAMAPILPAPKLVWYPDNGPTSPNYVNRREEVEWVNDWIRHFNHQNNIQEVPGFHVMGTRSTRRVVNGVQYESKTHRWNQWRASEAWEDKLHLVDQMRVKMRNYVLKYFQGERRRNGPLV